MNPKLNLPFNNDHDLLIGLLVDFNDTIGKIYEKINTSAADTAKTVDLINNVDKRVTGLEDKLEKIDIEKIAKQSQANADWIGEFTTMKHLAWVVASTFFFLIGWLWKPILEFFHLIK